MTGAGDDDSKPLKRGAQEMAVVFTMKYQGEHAHDPENMYGLGLTFDGQARVQFGGATILGRECHTLGELESIAKQLKAGIDEAMDEARKFFSHHSD
jgi:hypothetical protein